MLTGPGADLRGVREHLVHRVIAFEHERPQALPLTARDLAVAAQLQQIHRLAIEMADAMLGQNRRSWRLSHSRGNSAPLSSNRKPSAAPRPSRRVDRVQYCSGPA
jgi:hypothetical protein